MKSHPLSKPTGREGLAEDAPILREIEQIATQVVTALRTSVEGALRIGLRLMVIHRMSDGDDGGFKAALTRIEGLNIPRATAYRWINAVGRVLAQEQNLMDERGVYDPAELSIPESGSAAFSKVEKTLTEYAAGTSIRRLLLGSAATGEESRMDALITAAEAGDPLADEILDRVAKGEITLVQAIRARAGALKTKGKERRDPVYLDLDGATGQVTGLFPRCVITLSNTFDHWDSLDESARAAAKGVWKALVSKLPKDLR